MASKSTKPKLCKSALSCLVLFCALAQPAPGQEPTMQSLEKAYQSGNWKAAATIARELIGKNRDNLTARYYLGNIYTKLGLAHEAMSEYAYCVNFGKDSQVAGYAREAMKSIDQALSDKPLPTPAAKQLGTGAAGKTALQLKTEILSRGSQEVEDLKEKHRQTVAALKKETEAKAAPYLPPSLRNWDKGISPREQLAVTDDPNYRHFLELQIELSEKIYKLNQKLNDDIERVNETYKRQVEAIDQYGGARAGTAQVPILPEQGGGTLRNYVNYGKDEEVDTIPATAALTPKPASLDQVQKQKQKSKSPVKSSKTVKSAESKKKGP